MFEPALAWLRQWHILQTFHSFTFLFLSPSHCEAHSSSTTRRVTHHAEANMPIVCATSRVCKFHTCPIILNPSPPLPSLPFPSPPPFVPSLFSHMLLSPLLTHTSHWTAWGVGSSAALLRTCNREQGHPAGSDGNAEGLCLSHRPPLLVYKQVSLDSNPFFFFKYRGFQNQKKRWTAGPAVWSTEEERKMRCNKNTVVHSSASFLLWECFFCR